MLKFATEIFLKKFFGKIFAENGGGWILGELSSRKNENGVVMRNEIFAEMNLCIAKIQQAGIIV